MGSSNPYLAMKASLTKHRSKVKTPMLEPELDNDLEEGFRAFYANSPPTKMLNDGKMEKSQKMIQKLLMDQ